MLVYYSNQLLIIEAIYVKLNLFFNRLLFPNNTDYLNLYRVLFVALTDNEKLFATVTDRSVFLTKPSTFVIPLFVPITSSFLSVYSWRYNEYHGE